MTSLNSAPAAAQADTQIMTYNAAQGLAIAEEMRRDPMVFLMGQDVAMGGFFGGTRFLVEEFGAARVRDTGITEAFMAGCAAGAAIAGARPIVQMGFADFSLIAGDEIFHKLAKWRHMHGGLFTVPAVIILPYGTSGGVGPEHSSSPEVLGMHFAGLKVVIPSSPAEAKGLLKTAIRDPNPVLFYPSKSLGWVRGPVPMGADFTVPFGEAVIRRPGTTLTAVCYGGMVATVLEAAGRLAADGIETEIIDVRTLVPLDTGTIASSVLKTGRALVAHEAPRTAGPGAELAALITERCFDYLDAPVARVAGVDAPLPASGYLEPFCVPNADAVAAAAQRLVNE
jgi:pyruvate dehydrogenase E1 component beta subunit